MKPLGKVNVEWSPEFAYAIGLLTTDGNLSSDGRHMSLVSKDATLVELFARCLGLGNKVGRSISGNGVRCSRIQFGDVRFYTFLLSIGLMPNKSKILGYLHIPLIFFMDFLRGHFDGDGSFHSYWDKRWKSSFMFYTSFSSASKMHIRWLQKRVYDSAGVEGHITKCAANSAYQLKFAKAESLKLLPKMYYNRRVVCLSRKREKIEKALRVAGRRL